MKLSLRFFQTKINRRYPSASMHLAGVEMPSFSSLGVITSDMIASDELLYIDLLPCEAKDLPSSISVITTRARCGLFKECNLICVSDDTDLAEIVQLVSNVLMRYLGWADSIYEAIAKNVDLKTIINLTAAILENPIYIADSSFKMLAGWGGEFGEVNPTWRYQEKYLYLPYGVMQSISESGELDKLFNTPQAWLVEHSAGFTALPYISKAINKDGVHYGNFFIIGFYNQLTACDLELADYLGMVLSTALYGNLNYLETSTLYHNHFLEDVIEGTLTNERIVLDQLKVLHWNAQGDFMVALFNVSEDSDAIKQHLMTLIAAEFSAECFAYQGNAVAIFNDYMKRKRFIDKFLANSALTFNRTGATSEHFTDFYEISKYYNQARFALDIADRNDGRGTVLNYSEVFLRHALAVVGATIPHYTPASLLKEHDERYGTEYSHTLLTWLKHDRNTIHAAEVLYVHRNTLKNRLERIAEIIKVDLDNFDIRVRLLLALCAQAEGGGRPVTDGGR